MDVPVVAALAAFGGYYAANRPPRAGEGPSAFAQQVRLDPLYKTAVQADGRLRSFESHAKTYTGIVSGSRSIRSQSNGFTYLDLMFRPESYADTDLIYVKNKEVRVQILGALKGHADVDPARRDVIFKSGLFPRKIMNQPEVAALLQKLGQDLIRTSKVVDAINSALAVSDPRFLLDNLRLIAPPSGELNAPWRPMTDVVAARTAPQDSVHAGMAMPAPGVPGLDNELQKKPAETWSMLQSAWRAQDASMVNDQIAELTSLLPTIAPQFYPTEGRLAMESWYFRYQSMTWVWLIYLASVVPLLMSIIYKWDRARTIGMVLFVIAFAAHTGSVAIRWYISGRWPNSNMFEAVTTSAWFGGVAAMILERLTRRTPVRNVFALGSSVVSMAALMAAYFLPAQLDSAINNKMAALNDIWLYIHTNMIIWSYAVIGLACVPALLLLRHRWCLAWDQGAIPKLRLLILPVAAGILNYTAYLLLTHVIDKTAYGLPVRSLVGVTGAFWGSLMIVLMEALGARSRALSGGTVERSASGGASSLILGGSSGASFLRQERPTASQVFDGATMVLVELSFIMLWTGLVMGAIWADHSWGRPWGWDPKEVFALNTFIIFLVLIHVRLKVRDKAFWTGILAVVGFEVMMFNWIVMNFVISGLHSYA
jgi:cytochrome c-type biogenesis protein CcsB